MTDSTDPTSTEVPATTPVTVPTGDGDLSCFQFGTGVPEVLAIHGITGNHLAWVGLHQALPDTPMLTPDLRGRGASSELPGPFGMERHAADCALALRQTTDRPVVLVGHSMGAFVAITLAVQYPELVERLVLVDGGAPLPKPPGMAHTPLDEVAHAALGPAAHRLSRTFTSREEYVAQFREHPALRDHWSPAVEAYAAYDLTGEPPHMHARTSAEAMLTDFAELFVGGANEQVSARLQHRAEVLRAPHGLLDKSPLYPPGYLDAWATTLPEVRITEVGDVNHYTIVLGEGVQRVARAVLD